MGRFVIMYMNISSSFMTRSSRYGCGGGHGGTSCGTLNLDQRHAHSSVCPLQTSTTIAR
ncbi:UNVERIFIED_CONTAM: hypothetical protein Sindi_1823800 [Sesamum indicum]